MSSLKSRRAAARASFAGYDDFVAALTKARGRAGAALGRWDLVPGASIWARIPVKWASCRVFGRTCKLPRDQKFPAAKYWPGGVLPVGPEYAA